MRVLTVTLLQLILAWGAAAQELYLERLREGDAENLLRLELMELELKLKPYPVYWLEPDEWEVPTGSWGFGRWTVREDGYDFLIHSAFVSPQSVSGAQRSPVGACRGCLRKTGGRVNRVVIENALNDLLNQTLFDPVRGFMGHVEARACSPEDNRIYRFPGARLTALESNPGLSKVNPEYWDRIYLGLEGSRVPDGPVEFHSLQDQSPTSSLVRILHDPTASELLLEARGLSRRQWRLLPTDLCTGASLQDSRLRLMLAQEEIVPLTYPMLGRSDSASGGD